MYLPEGFDPDTRCATCLPGFFGEKCKRCPDCNFPHGNCDDGLMGSGRCSCAVGFDADNNCMECMGSFSDQPASHVSHATVASATTVFLAMANVCVRKGFRRSLDVLSAKMDFMGRRARRAARVTTMVAATIPMLVTEHAFATKVTPLKADARCVTTAGTLIP